MPIFLHGTFIDCKSKIEQKIFSLDIIDSDTPKNWQFSYGSVYQKFETQGEMFFILAAEHPPK